MRLRTRLALGLLIAGSVVLLVSSGAFDTILADRNANIETAEQEQNALLGVEGPVGGTIQLNEQNSYWCPGLFDICYYDDVEVMTLSDNTPANTLETLEIRNSTSGDDVVFDFFWGQGIFTEGEIQNGQVTISGDFICPYSRGRQQSAVGTITSEIGATDGNLTINMTRQTTVHCMAG